MEAFKKILKSSALVVGSFFLLRVVAAVEPNTGLFLSGIVLLLAAVAFFNPMPQYWIYGRATAVALLVTAMISLAFSGSKLNEERNATLLALRSQNPKAYLERIRPARSNEFFITEARELLRTADPQAYLTAVRGNMDSTQYLVELKALDSAAYQVELDRLAAEQKAEQEAREEKLRTELADLKAKLVRAPNLTEAEQLKLYTRISELDSRNLIYAKERDRFKAIVQAQEEKARAEKRRLEELSRARSAPEAFLEIVDFNWSKEAFGSIMEATFIIKNNAPIDIKDITVLCEHSAASGTTGTVGPFTT